MTQRHRRDGTTSPRDRRGVITHSQFGLSGGSSRLSRQWDADGSPQSTAVSSVPDTGIQLYAGSCVYTVTPPCSARLGGGDTARGVQLYSGHVAFTSQQLCRYLCGAGKRDAGRRPELRVRGKIRASTHEAPVCLHTRNAKPSLNSEICSTALRCTDQAACNAIDFPNANRIPRCTKITSA